MTTIERAQFKTDPVLNKLYHVILANYQVPAHTQNELLANRHVKGFCVETRHFVELAGSPSIYIHFDVSSWFDPSGFPTRIERIAIYNDFKEYEPNRLKTLHGSVHSDGVCLN